jgi:hypothetical protein
VFISKEKYNQCNTLKNLLDEKGIGYACLDMLEMLEMPGDAGDAT